MGLSVISVQLFYRQILHEAFKTGAVALSKDSSDVTTASKKSELIGAHISRESTAWADSPFLDSPLVIGLVPAEMRMTAIGSKTQLAVSRIFSWLP